jgi:hypothetical protein
MRLEQKLRETVDSFKRTLREKGITEEQLLAAQSLPQNEPTPLAGEPGTRPFHLMVTPNLGMCSSSDELHIWRRVPPSPH